MNHQTTMPKQRALVIRLSSLGDIVLTQPVLAQMERAGYRVDLFVKPEYVALGKLLPGAARVLSAPADLEPRYALVLDLHDTPRSRRLGRRVQAGRKLRYNKHPLARRLLVRPAGRRMPWHAWESIAQGQQVTEWYAAAARQAGIAAPTLPPRLALPEWVLAAAEQILRGAKLAGQDRFAVLAPGAAWPAKQWPQEHFAQTARLLQSELGLRPVFIGSAGERKLCETLAQQTGGKAVSLAGLTSLPTLAAVLSLAEVLVTNDSGPLHLGLAAGAPAVALFGPTVSAFGFAPLTHPRARVLEQNLHCRPCSLHGGVRCPLQHHHCLSLTTPEQAVAACRDLLATQPLSKRSA
ncbi:MAG: glycosyltransferase family 9 protein [candidate division FCPU426 bacterium]